MSQLKSFDLNLLPSQARFQAHRLKLKKNVDRWAKIIGSVGLGVVVLIAGLWVLGKVLLIETDKNYEKAVADYSVQTDNVVVSQLLKYRAKVVGRALGERYEYSKAFDAIYDVFPENEVRDVELLADNSFRLKIEASGSAEMDELEKRVEDINSTQATGLKWAKLVEVGVAEGKWSVEVEVEPK